MASVFDMTTVLGAVSMVDVGPWTVIFGVSLAALAWIARGTGEHVRRVAAREWHTRNTDVTVDGETETRHRA